MTDLDELITAWGAFANHGEDCEHCRVPMRRLRQGDPRFESCWVFMCDHGRHLAEVWQAVAGGLVLSRRQRGA